MAKNGFDWTRLDLPEDLRSLLKAAPSIQWPDTEADLIDAAVGGKQNDYAEVAYDVPGKGRVVEATVARVRNGIAANYPEPYMRRRDPDCMFIADDQPTNKVRFKDRFGDEFSKLREETMAWRKKQELAAVAFSARIAH